MDKLKLIKSIVVIITFLLVFGSLLLLTVIYKKAQPKQDIYQEKNLAQPIGSSISSVTTVGNNLAILIKDGGEADRIVIYNPQTLQKVSTIHLQETSNE
ncbi:MAG: hypothetical protein IJ660_07055 [Alphaproteobacteria bacterium]|nr:hypothetical protein [Alphaproteobacteria bacterium]